MMNEQRSDDVRSLFWIGGSALAGVLISAAFASADSDHEHYSRRVEVREVHRPHVIASVATPLSSNGRLYGRVVTRDGSEYTGFIRWDRNEGSWADVLDASKDGSSTRSGIRFGHVQRIDVAGRSRALLLLRSGEVTEMSSRSSDLGMSLRAITIEQAPGSSVGLSWRELSSVEFLDAPADAIPGASRLYGTLITADGRSFTGPIAWDVDEIYSTDLLEGDAEDGRRVELSFGEIVSIARNNDESARVVLGSGGQMILHGTNDVDRSIRGITVSDPNLGEVKVGWDAFGEVRFHEPASDAPATLYDGGHRMRGTVVTRSGRSFTGDVRWDDDESYSWEILNGDAAGAELQVELGQVATITREGRGVVVELLDGRSLRLDGSNDVDASNRGIVIEDELGAHRIDWSDFVELRLQP